MTVNPVLVENVRGSLVENHHRGAVVVMNYQGRLLAGWGDIDRPVYARSSIKYLQTIPLLESGAAEAFQLTHREIALACASHTGEGPHVEAVSQWLGAIGLTLGDLKCGKSRPLHGPSYKDLVRTGQTYTELHNPCSGKHTGFLTTCLHQGHSTKDYHLPDHPVQQQAAEIVEELIQVDGKTLPTATDGCNIPAYAYPLKNIALGMTRLSPKTTGLSVTRKSVVGKIREAITMHPFMVAGTNKFDTVMMEETQGDVLVKVGADGIYTACLPELGIGIALKIDDGNGKAAEIAMGTVLSHYYSFDHAHIARLKSMTEPAILNASKVDTGLYRPSYSWLSLRT